MAELNTGDSGGGKGGKVRSKKQNSKVDLTAMVDLAFLLITFFMLTTTLSKPQSMTLGLPAKEKDKPEEDTKVDEKLTVTLLLGKDNKLIFYSGLLETPITPPKDATYGKDGIREELLKRKKVIDAYIKSTGSAKKAMTVIIKPSKKSNYKNVVDVLDEMAILKVPIYAIVNDFTPEETKLLEETNQ